jgi:hypothetical protein
MILDIIEGMGKELTGGGEDLSLLEASLNAVIAHINFGRTAAYVSHLELLTDLSKEKLQASLALANTKLNEFKEALEHAPNDMVFYGFLGDIAYWETIINLLRAAQLVWPYNLPNVPLPSLEGLTMDLPTIVKKYGEEVLRLAQKQINDEV